MLVTSQDDGTSKDYSQWLAVEVIAAADGAAVYKKATASGQMRKLYLGWLLVRCEDGGVEEWLRLPGNAFNSNALGSWRIDLDFNAAAAGAGSTTSEAEVGYDAGGVVVKAVTATRTRTPRTTTKARTTTTTRRRRRRGTTTTRRRRTEAIRIK